MRGSERERAPITCGQLYLENGNCLMKGIGFEPQR